MKCPECQREVDEKLRYCPECGAPLPKNEKPAAKPKTSEEPKLGKGLMIFIGAGLLFLIVFGLVYCVNHRDDPEYFKTLIDPDSTLADKDLVVFDTVAIDTAAAKKAEKEEQREAEKIFNSIRRKSEPKEEAQPAEGSSEGQEGSSSTDGQAATPTSEAVPAPKVEAIETE